MCGQLGCKPSTCPKGEAARLQGEVDLKEHEAVSDEENAEQCLVSSHALPNLPRLNSELSPEVFPKFLGTVCYEFSHDHETPTERACIAVAPVIPPYLHPGLAKHGDTVVHIYQAQCRIIPDPTLEKGAVVDVYRCPTRSRKILFGNRGSHG